MEILCGIADGIDVVELVVLVAPCIWAARDVILIVLVPKEDRHKAIRGLRRGRSSHVPTMEE